MASFQFAMPNTGINCTSEDIMKIKPIKRILFLMLTECRR